MELLDAGGAPRAGLADPPLADSDIAQHGDLYENISIHDLTGRTAAYEGRKVVLAGRVIAVEEQPDESAYVLLEVRFPDHPARAGVAAFAWGGADCPQVRPGQGMIVWGTVVGSHLSGGRGCGYTLSPELRVERTVIS